MNNADNYYMAKKKKRHALEMNTHMKEMEMLSFQTETPKGRGQLVNTGGNWEDNIEIDLRKYCVCRYELI